MSDEGDRNESERRSVLHPLALPRLLGGALSDIRAIAEGMAVLPSLLATLQAIESRVDTLNDEVRKMRLGVDGMGGNVDEMRASLGRVEPHLESVGRIVSPLRRLRRREPNGDAVEAEDAVEADELELAAELDPETTPADEPER